MEKGFLLYADNLAPANLKDKQRRMNCFTKKLRNTHLPLLRITLKSFLDLMSIAAFFYFFTDPPWEIPIFHKPSV